MSAWEEIAKLQASLKRTQLSTTKQKLSERNCIEILAKLQVMNLINVIHTSDGKEYLTPKQLMREIRDELYMHGGRINLVELQESLNIDFTHIEAKCNEIVKSDRNLQLIYGQLVESSYLDQLAEEINDNLQSCGQVTIAELSKTYDLPGEFLVPELMSRLGRIIHGQIDKHKRDAIFTDAYVATHKARIRGILSAVTRPTQAQALLSHNLPLQLLFSIVEDLFKEGRIKGQMTGGRSEKSTFLPDIHTQTQNHWVDNFYQQNGYLEFDAVARLGIGDPKSYLKRRLDSSEKGPLFLQTVCIGGSLIDQVISAVDDAVANNEWTDVSLILPSSFTSDDSNQLLHHILREKRKETTSFPGVIFADTIIASQSFVDSCMKYFNPMMREKAEKDAKKASIFALTEEERKQYTSEQAKQTLESNKKSEKKDERKKKAVEGSASVKRFGEGGGGGAGAREMKTKGKDKKRLKWKKEQELQMEEKSSKRQQDEVIFMDVSEITDVLCDRLPQCPDGFLEEIAAKLQRPLTASYQTEVKSVFLQSAQQQREKQSDKSKSDLNQERKQTLHSRRQLEEDVNMVWTNIRLFIDAFKYFEGDVVTTLHKHLLKTACTSLTNTLFVLMNGEFISGPSVEDITAEVRIKMISRYSSSIKSSLSRVHESLTGKNIDNFMTSFTSACAPDACDVMLRNADKKRDRQVSHGHKMSHIQQLKHETDPALVLHRTSLVIFQSVTGSMLDAPGKLVPNIIDGLQQFIERDVYVKLLSYQQLVMKHSLLLCHDQDKVGMLSHVEVKNIEDKLKERLEEIKNLATTTKKKQIN